MYVFILNPSGEYCNAVMCSIGIGLSHIFIGATLMSLLMYSIQEGLTDLHILLCAFGYHFFSAEALLSLHYANGWSTPMRMRHRRIAHVFLNCCGIACAIAGTVLVILKKGISVQPHGLTGMLTSIFAVISAIFGLLAFTGKKSCLLTMHMTFGIPTFIMSSISICLGFFLKPFTDWAGATVVYILTSIVVFYTSFIVASSITKCISRL